MSGKQNIWRKGGQGKRMGVQLLRDWELRGPFQSCIPKICLRLDFVLRSYLENKIHNCFHMILLPTAPFHSSIGPLTLKCWENWDMGSPGSKENYSCLMFSWLHYPSNTQMNAFQGYCCKPMLFLLAFSDDEAWASAHLRICTSATQDSPPWAHRGILVLTPWVPTLEAA